MSKTKLSLYECVFIARPDLSSAQVESLANLFSGVITQGGGKVKKVEYCGLRQLAYRIRKNRRAYYVLINIEAPAETVHEMERQMGLNEDVMRHLTVLVDKHEEGVSALSFKRTETDAPTTGGFGYQKDAPAKEGGYRRQFKSEESETVEEVSDQLVNS
jgi:small subunit ribosomal protein S6